MNILISTEIKCGNSYSKTIWQRSPRALEKEAWLIFLSKLKTSRAINVKKLQILQALRRINSISEQQFFLKKIPYGSINGTSQKGLSEVRMSHLSSEETS